MMIIFLNELLTLLVFFIFTFAQNVLLHGFGLSLRLQIINLQTFIDQFRFDWIAYEYLFDQFVFIIVHVLQILDL